MYFQISAARGTDRRLVIYGLPAARLVTARLAAGLALAVLASAAALAAVAARYGGIADPGRVIAGTLMFAVIYLAVGALAGALVRQPAQRHPADPVPVDRAMSGLCWQASGPARCWPPACP